MEPFDNVTTYFSGSKYATLLIPSPLIQTLKYIFANVEITDDILNKEDKPDTAYYFRHEESSDDDSNELDFEISKTLTNHHQIDSNRVTPTNSSNNLLQNAQEEAKAELTRQFELLIATNLEQTAVSIFETSKNSDICRGRLYSSIFGTFTNNLNF
ncbi:8343_t:CDS:2, partial [Dentiscutata erythropus]